MSLGLALKLSTATLFKGLGFSLPAFMAGQTDGFWYDFADTDTLFQENVGPTPADEPNEVIGLALSQRTWNGQTLAQVVAAAPELITNGTFALDANWTKGAGVTISGGVANIGAGAGYLEQGIATVAGRTYRVQATAAGNAVYCGAWANAGQTSSLSGSPGGRAAGSVAFFFTAAGSTSYIAFNATGAGALTIDNVSVKEVSRYAATQASTSLRPKFQTTGAAFDGSDDTLLTGYLAGATANFVVAKVTVPATLAATQIFAGAVGAAGANICRVGFGTDGFLRVGLGATAVISGVTDL